jgi:hemerythrin-like domain-containing protein
MKGVILFGALCRPPLTPLKSAAAAARHAAPPMLPEEANPFALRVMRDEHYALAAMLRSLKALLRRARQAGTPPPFDVLRSMLLYIDEFPERRHQPKESKLLFPKLRALAPELQPVLDRLDADHARGPAAIRELEHLLLAWEVMGEARRAAFEDAAQRFTTGYLEHMACEEQEVLPLALRVFSKADWDDLEAAFAANRDPFTGHDADDEYRPLFERIVATAPAPIGLG